jgi:RHS repeat-associated protein
MIEVQRFCTVLALTLMLAAPTAWALGDGGRCIIIVDRFEDQTDLPQFVPVLDQAAWVNNPLTFDIDTSTPASQDELTFQLIRRPAGMTIDEFTGAVSWVPNQKQLGIHSATVAVTDSEQRRSRHTFCVIVRQPPVRLSDPGTLTLVAGELLSVQLQAASNDPDAVLSFSKQDGPDDLSIDQTSGAVNWLTDFGDLGVHPVLARAADQNGLFDEELFLVEVTEPIGDGPFENSAPTLDPIADQFVTVGQNLTIQTAASDPDVGPLSYELLAAPAGMTIDANGLIDFSPTAGQSGPYSVNVRVSDPFDLGDSESFVVTVLANNAPVALDDGYELHFDDVLTVPMPGVLGNDSDPDSDPLSAQLLTDPTEGSVILNADGSFEYTPDDPDGEIGFVAALEFMSPGGGPLAPPKVVDMNDDGRVDVFSQVSNGVAGQNIFFVSSPDTGELISRSPPLDRGVINGTGKAIADIDLDGYVEIISIGGENSASVPDMTRVFAFEHDGTFKWKSEQLAERYVVNGVRSTFGDGGLSGAEPSIADLDQDGTPEIIVGHGVIADGTSQDGVAVTVFDTQGMKLFTAYARGIEAGRTSMRAEVVDLDLDGDLEILVGSAAFSHTGELLWAHPGIRNFERRATPISANLDGDPFPELILASNASEVIALNHDGDPEPIWRAATVGNFATWEVELVVADVDDDGPVEILAVGNNGFGPSTLEVLNGKDGTLKWAYSGDGSGLNLGTIAPTVFDLDGDGDTEVLLFGFQPRTLYVLEGATGQLIEEFDLGLGNPPAFEIPFFADVDDDGAAELLLNGTFRFGAGASSAYWVFEAPNDDWAPARSIWNQWNYHVTNVNDDGTIPQFEQPHWLLPGLNQNRVNSRLIAPRDEVLDQFTYEVSDGQLTDEATVYLTLLPGVQPRFTSAPDTTATVGFAYLYAPQVFDPDLGDSFTFSLTEGPPDMSIDPLTGLIRWTPDATGAVEVAITVSDSTSLSAEQRFTLTVGEPVVVPDLIGLDEAAAQAALDGADLVTGRSRDVFNLDFPAGQVAEQRPLPGVQAEFGSSVDLFVSLGLAPEDIDNDLDTFTERQGDCDDADNTIFPGAPDPEGDGIDQNCDGVDGELALVSIELSPAESIVLSNRIIDYQAVGIRADGTAVNLNGLGLFESSDIDVAQLLGDRRVRSAVPGTATISLSHLGVTGEATITVVAGASLDNEPPTAEITAPVSAEKVTRPIEVIGTADDPNLLRWELLTTAGEDGEATLLNQSTSPVVDDVLGELDPTLLLNGVQTLILRVHDRGENVSEARVNVTVEEDYKVGNFTLSFEDLDIQLASLPITVNRTYDSREKRRGDFGIGWDLGLRTVEVRTSRVLGTGWEVLGGGNSFLLNPTDDHLVTVTLPDGEVETFELTVTPSSSFLVPFSFLTASLEPVGDTLGELTLLDNPFLAIADGQPGPVQLLDDASFEVFNPDRFRYVARNGLEFVVSRSEGLESFSDTNGNTLTFTPNAITHSNGTEVQFQRDGLGRITRLTGPDGHQQFYQYDSLGHLAAHTDAEGNITRFRYDRRANLLEVIDPRGNRAVRNEYDDDGRLIAIVDAEGHRIEFTHDIEGRQQLIEDANGNIQRLLLDDDGNVLVRERTVTVDGLPSVAVEQFEYDERGNTLVEIDPDGIRTEMTWDDNDNLLQTVIDSGGLNLTTSSTYDENNNRLSETDPLGRVTTYTYDEDDNVLTVTDPLGGVTAFGYNGDGRLATMTDPVGTVTSYVYDASGQLIQEDLNADDGTLLSRKTYTYDASARRLTESVHRMIDGVLTPLTTSYAYDNNGRPIRMTDPLGHVMQTEYDAAGNVSAQIDALGRRTEHSYDSRGQRVETTFPDGTSISMAYDPAGNVISRTDEAGRVTTYEYDELNRQIAVVHPDGAREEDVLSEGGQTIATIDANGHRTDFSYDAAGRQISVISPQVVDARDGSFTRPTVTQAYDAAGRVISTTDANGYTTSFTYDELGRLTRTDHPDGTFTTQGFDAAGRVTSTTDELGRTTDYVYDGRGQLLRVTEPAPENGEPRPVTTYTWDLTGNRLTQTDALGRTTRLRYDALNRQTRRTLPGGQFASAEYDPVGNLIVQTDFNGQSVEFVYDERDRLIERILPDGEVHAFSYSPTGARETASDANGTRTFSYDTRDRLTGLTQADGSTLSYQFDPVGNLVQTATATQTTDYSYDALNRMLTSTTGTEQTEYGYDPNGNPVTLSHANDATTEKTFDSRNRVLSIEHRDATDTVLDSFVHTYRANGQRETVTEFDGSVETYSYDDLDRLVSETRTGTHPRTIEYEYDLVGNRIQINEDGAIRSATYDANDRLLSEGPKTFTYDANGNRTSVNDNGAIQLLNWNALNRLTSVERGTGTTTFRYNADGDRIATDREASTERYLIDPQNPTGFSQVTETRNAQGSLLESFRYGSDLISRADAGEGTRYFHTDALGSTRLLTDEATQATDRYAYTGYGVLASTTGSSDNPYLYAGERSEEDSGNYDLRARFYDPHSGRFLSRDPFPGLLEQPVLLHPYLYGSADPINNIDPSGLFSVMDVTASLSIIAQNIAIRYPQVCTAVGAAEKVATAASLIGIGLTFAIQPPPPPSGKYSFAVGVPRSFSPLKKIAYDYSGSSDSRNYKFTFEFAESASKSKIAGGVTIDSQGIASFTGEFSSSVDFELATLDFCLIDLATLTAKIGTADRAGFGGGADFSGFNALGKTFGGNTEAKGSLEFQAGPIVLEATLFTVRIGGGNAGFHLGGIN